MLHGPIVKERSRGISRDQFGDFEPFGSFLVRALAVGDLRIGGGSLLRPATRPNTNFNVRKAPPDAESVPAFRRVNGASLSQTAGGQPQIASPSAPR